MEWSWSSQREMGHSGSIAGRGLAPIFTVGHSTRTAEQFLALLRAHGVTALADVRALPRSRRHPHFSDGSLARWLSSSGIQYRHFRGLGGHRQPLPESHNGAWRHRAFRGYADYMATASFARSVDELLAFAGSCTVAMMCAEARWEDCHRQLIADALVARGVQVRHILTAREASRHDMTPFARVQGSRVQYPGLI
jgi:uncharacterized protein (DUF488 family)